MKVLIAGGVKTQNIVNELEKKYSNGGIDFIVVQYIEDIEDIFSRGEYFDRALIIEQCWNHDFEDTDEKSTRDRINLFARNSANRRIRGVNYVFLTQTEEEASKVYEEILPIKQDSVVVVKAPKYSVNFFASLITVDTEQFPENIVYTPYIEVSQTEKDTNINKQSSDEKVNEYSQQEIDDISKELYDLGVDLSESFDNVEDDIDLDWDSVVCLDTHENEESNNTDLEDSENNDIVDEDDLDDFIYSKEGEDVDEDDLDDFIQSKESEEVDEELVEVCNFNDNTDTEDEDTEEDLVEVSNFNTNTEDEDIEVMGDEANLMASDIIYNEDESDNLNHVDNIELEEEINTVGVYDIDEDKEHSISGQFDESDYQKEDLNNTEKRVEKLDISNQQIKAVIDALTSRGRSIVVTGAGGCGISTVAYHLANTVANLGYTVLLVDMDTTGRSQACISKDNYDCIEKNGVGLLAAIKSSHGIHAHLSIAKEGFRLLTMGLAGDIVELDKIISETKISRFINSARDTHNFVIYDIPFEHAVGCASEVTFMADDIVFTVDSSNWGVTKAMISLCNIENEEMQEIMFNRAQLLFNRYKGFKNVLGKKVKTALDVVNAMDNEVVELIGDDPGYYFKDINICGILSENQEYENGWYNHKQYSDTKKGQEVFIEILKGILLKR